MSTGACGVLHGKGTTRLCSIHDIIVPKYEHNAKFVWDDNELVLILLKSVSTTSHSIMNTLEKTYAFKYWINKHGLPITTTKSKEVRHSKRVFRWRFIADHLIIIQTQFWRTLIIINTKYYLRARKKKGTPKQHPRTFNTTTTYSKHRRGLDFISFHFTPITSPFRAQ